MSTPKKNRTIRNLDRSIALSLTCACVDFIGRVGASPEANRVASNVTLLAGYFLLGKLSGLALSSGGVEAQECADQLRYTVEEIVDDARLIVSRCQSMHESDFNELEVAADRLEALVELALVSLLPSQLHSASADAARPSKAVQVEAVLS